MPDLACCLKCAPTPKKKATNREFIGTVKILLVDSPPSEYLWKRIDAGLITLAYFMMGAVVMNVLFFTLTFKLPFFMNLHIVFGTLGYQLCIPCGMLIMNNLSGSSNVLKLSDRKFEHVCLQIFGLGLGIVGTFCVYLKRNVLTIHSVCGLMAGACGFAALILGAMLNSEGNSVHLVKIMHLVCAVICLVASSICMISGLHRYCIFFWLPVENMAYFLCLLCFLYTAIIVKNVFKSMRTYHSEGT